jgi:hypothetical protein
VKRLRSLGASLDLLNKLRLFLLSIEGANKLALALLFADGLNKKDGLSIGSSLGY